MFYDFFSFHHLRSIEDAARYQGEGGEEGVVRHDEPPRGDQAPHSLLRSVHLHPHPPQLLPHLQEEGREGGHLLQVPHHPDGQGVGPLQEVAGEGSIAPPVLNLWLPEALEQGTL